MNAHVLLTLTALTSATSLGCAPQHEANPLTGELSATTRLLAMSPPPRANALVFAQNVLDEPDTTDTAEPRPSEPQAQAKAKAKTATVQKGRAAKKGAKKMMMSREQVREANEALIAQISRDLRDRSFKWGSIVIHHTASEWSSLEKIDAFHRRKFDDPDGIEYHFLIGNGKNAPDGLIELGRWPLQKRSIHLFKPEGWPASITISLVGNFHERDLDRAQFEALRDLIIELASTYDIPANRITTHTRIDGRLTVCPGKHFPYRKLMKQVRPALEDDAR